MTENMTSVSRDAPIVPNSFELFDAFLNRDKAVGGDDAVECEETVDEIIDEESASSSSYYEEEILEDSIGLDLGIRLDTVHEDSHHEIDESETNGDDYNSETEFWEDVSGSINCESENDDDDDGDITQELQTNSDMIALVRNMLSGDTNKNNDQDENSSVDFSTGGSSTSDGGSSSLLPLDFDMGSEGELHSSDEEEEKPNDYEQACRLMIATISPQMDPDTMIHGMDLKNLYTNLKQQYRHILRNAPEASMTDTNDPGLFEEERAIIEHDVNQVTENSLQSNNSSASHWNFVSPEPILDDVEFEDANKIPPVEHSNDASRIYNHSANEMIATPPTISIEKWLDRDADDPEDYEYACRRLCQSMYDGNNPDYDVDTMLRRSTPIALYRYLKHHYWYLDHTNQLDENGFYRNEEDEQQQNDSNLVANDVPKSKSDETQNLAANNVKSLRAIFSARAETPKEREERLQETSSEARTKNADIHKEKTFIQCDDQQSSTERIENNEDDNLLSHSDEKKTEMPSSKDENGCLTIDESPLPIQKISFDDDESSDGFIDNAESVQEEIVQNNLDNSAGSSSAYIDVFDDSDESVEDDIVQNNLDYSAASFSASIDTFDDSDKSVEDDIVQNNLDYSAASLSASSDNSDGTEELVQEEIVQNSLNNSAASLSASSDNSNGTEELVREEIVHNSLNNSAVSLSPSSDSFDDTEESAQEKIVQNNTKTGAVSSSIEKESSVLVEKEEIDMNEACSESYGSFQDENAREFNNMLARTKNEEDFDENRLHILELSDTKTRDERLTEDEIRDAEELELTHENEGCTENCSSNDSTSGATPIYVPEMKKSPPIDSVAHSNEKSNEIPKVNQSISCGDAIDFNCGSEDDQKLIIEKDLLIENKLAHDEGQIPKTTVKDPKEIEWRKKKIQKDLRSIIKEAEKRELHQPISSEIVAALIAGSLKTAFIKKYYRPEQDDHIYYPSVAKAVHDFSLIEATEIVLRNELPFEFSTALCTIASFRIKGNDNEVNENDVAIREATVTVVLDDEIEAGSDEKAMSSKMIEDETLISIANSHLRGNDNESDDGKIIKNSVDVIRHDSKVSPSDSCDANRESSAEVLSENELRKRRIKNELDSIIIHAKENEIGDEIEDEAIDALVRAANEIVYIKKYYEVTTDKFQYFPSLKKAILNGSLAERAEDLYFNGDQDFPLEYTSAIQASAARFHEDFEVDELDDDVINMTVNVDIDDTQALTQVNEECSSSNTSVAAKGCIENLKTQLESDFTSLTQFSEEANKQDDKNEITEAILDEKASFLVQKYLDDRQQIDQALVDLESEFSSELNRLDNEANACSLKHEIEADRIEKDRNEFRANENNDGAKQTKTLLEKLSTAIAVLELERHNTSTGMEMVETENEETKSWGFFNKQSKNKLQKEKERQIKLMEFKLREIELEKVIDDIKAQLDQAKEKENNASEWQAELDEEYRHLEDLTSATEEKLKEEVRHLNNSYAEERQRLIKEKVALEETRKEDDIWVASEKKKLHYKYNLERRGISSAESKRNEMDNDEEDDLNENAISLKAKQDEEEKSLLLERETFGRKKEGHNAVDLSLNNKDNLDLGSDHKVRVIDQAAGETMIHQSNAQDISEKERSKCKQTLSEENSFVDEGALAKADYLRIPKIESEIVNTDYEGVSSESNTQISEDEMLDKAATEVNYGKEDHIQSNASGIAEMRLTEVRSDESDSNSTLSKTTTDIKEDENSSKSGECIVTDHLESLNQPRELEDDAPLESLEVCDLPEVSEVSSKNLLAPDLKAKSEEDVEAKPTEDDAQAMPDPLELQDRPKQSQDELSPVSPRVLDLSTVCDFSSEKFSATALEGKQKEVAKTLPAETHNETINTTDKRNPSKSLSQMRLKVDEALERAIAIRNGDMSSHNDRIISQESQMGRQVQNGSIGTTNGAHLEESPSKSINRSTTAPSPSPSLSRQSTHPMNAMIRETDRLSGFIRRYEKKLEQVCKSLLTLASVDGEENEILASRQLDLPQMFEFVVKQDWYKTHSKDTKSKGVPNFIFSKPKGGNEHNSVGENGYTITKTGKLFLQIDGPVPSDVCRFLSYLDHIEEGLTRDAMLEQWKEIFRLSGDEQSQRICDNLDKVISFCLDSNMIKK